MSRNCTPTAAPSQQARTAQPSTCAVAASDAPARQPKTMLMNEIAFGVARWLASQVARFLKNSQSRVFNGRRPDVSMGIN
ncbi:hypothetical protein CfE428DRAFT_0663 [Chthoniobacter flavus Ellin428]|uniref:Uncharacterized protein n=2 Tax=Chthoniobacter flavus TaxID=191863 RepID=B4CVH6_9BACT|nr:hypothetical protein CfE428DRAFT_0663 [Chthoniobacter flavus Ellin428]